MESSDKHLSKPPKIVQNSTNIFLGQTNESGIILNKKSFPDKCWCVPDNVSGASVYSIATYIAAPLEEFINCSFKRCIRL